MASSRSPTSSGTAVTPVSSPTTPARDELGLQLGAMIDGLAIQVLMNDATFSPQRMFEVCMDVASKLIGFSVEPVAASK